MSDQLSLKPVEQVLSGVIRRNAIEDISGAVRNFFDLHAVQLEPGPCHCQIDFIAAGNTFLYREHYPIRTQLRGELLHNRFGVAIPATVHGLKFSGEEMDQCRLASALTGEEMDVYAPNGLKQFVVLLDQARLASLADQAGLPQEVQCAIRPGRSSMPLAARPEAVAAFGLGMANYLQAASAGDLQVGARDFEDWVYGQALAILDVQDVPCGRPPAAVLVRRALDLAGAKHGPVRMAHLCSVLRVSPSTLKNAFKSVTGVTPHAFFLRRRLNEARTTLLRADGRERKVTEIATWLGFTELGRFSVRYREMFGESPSQTLQKQISTVVPVAGR